RYYVEGILAVIYGRRVLLFLRDNGLVIISMVATIILIGLLIYYFVNKRKVAAIMAEADDQPLDASPDTERVID
ncbi:MAG TPA: hypothetical protein VFH91_09655, partial [Pyrinomonadaceae bacterium]|nr:hypothetical protein [Pyrinomonadaceae bacterium]